MDIVRRLPCAGQLRSGPSGVTLEELVFRLGAREGEAFRCGIADEVGIINDHLLTRMTQRALPRGPHRARHEFHDSEGDPNEESPADQGLSYGEAPGVAGDVRDAHGF